MSKASKTPEPAKSIKLSRSLPKDSRSPGDAERQASETEVGDMADKIMRAPKTKRKPA